MKIALSQLDMGFENKELAIEKCKICMEQAQKQNVDLIVFPEMTLTGFTMQPEIYGEIKKDSSTVTFFQNSAKQYKMGIVFGVIFQTGGKAENHCVIVNKYGEIVADYTKIHPFSYGAESKYYIGGNDICFCTIDGVPLTPFVCYDLRFPEIFQAASKKSKIITVIANWPVARVEHWKVLLQARAIENQCFIVGVNRSGTDATLTYSGDSMLISPTGEILAHLTDKNQLAVVDIDITQADKYRVEFPLKSDRKEILYTKLFQEIDV